MTEFPQNLEQKSCTWLRALEHVSDAKNMLQDWPECARLSTALLHITNNVMHVIVVCMPKDVGAIRYIFIVGWDFSMHTLKPI